MRFLPLPPRRRLLSRILLAVAALVWPDSGSVRHGPAASAAAGTAAAATAATAPPAARWWKGNLHTHSLWSDGDDFPEMIVAGYKRKGYHFLALSDHNVLSQGELWIDAVPSKVSPRALNEYRKRFGERWVGQRTAANGTPQVRLKPLNEYRTLFEEPGRFLLIQAEEITDHFRQVPVHVNATNLLERILPQGGNSVLDVLQRNVDAVLEQRRRTGRVMFPHVNHPNFGWAVTAGDLARLRGERFFEVYNGHPAVNNAGDARRAGTERIWDVALTERLTMASGGGGAAEPLFGIATDDSHHYHEQGPNRSNSGRGWVMVRSRYLTPESIVLAMEAGDFYASTGVVLKTVRRDAGRLAVEIDARRGVRYTTRFIGTRRGLRDGIGIVLAQATGATASYALRGDELYVRARITSSKPQPNATTPGEVETAWTQPVFGVPTR